MRKPLMLKANGQLPLAEMDPQAFVKAPYTRGFFLDCLYVGSEEERAPGSLTLRPDGNRWTITLRDPTSMKQIFLAASTLADLWKLVEAVLGDEKAPWVDDRFAMERASVGRKKRG